MPLLAAFLLAQAALKPYSLSGFTVSLPAAPKSLNIPGAPKEVKAWQVVTPGGTALTVTYVQAPAEGRSMDRRLADFAVGIAIGAKGTMTGQKDLLVRGWPGLETTMTTPQGLTWGRAYAFPSSIFGVIGSGSKASESFVRAVLDSIVLDPKIGDGPVQTAGPTWTRQPIGASYSVEFPVKADERLEADTPTSKRTRWNAIYGNRFFSVSVTTLGDEVTPVEDAALLSTAKEANSAAVETLKGKIVTRREVTLLGKGGELVEATTPDGANAVFFQSIVSPKGVVIFTVVVPKFLRTSPEVTRFLSSLAAAE